MQNREYYMRRAEVGFKTLVIYFCVSRPQYEKAYHKDGKFDQDVLMRQMDFLSTWKKRSKREMELLAKRYSKYARTFNYTFDIPVGLVQKVLGKYRGNRISIEEITAKLIKEGWLRVLNAGTKTQEDDYGKRHVVCWWHNKYLLANKKYWLQLLSDKKYSNYQKYPRDKEGFVQRAVSIIAKYRKRTINKEDDMTVEELKEEWVKEAQNAESTCGVEVQMDNKQEDIYADIPPEPPKPEPVVEVEPPKQLKPLSGRQMRKLDDYFSRLKDGVLLPETFKKYIKEEFTGWGDEVRAYYKAKSSQNGK